MTEKYKDQQKHATIIHKDTVKQSKDSLQQFLGSRPSMTSKNTQSVSNPNSASQSPLNRQSSHPRMFQLPVDGGQNTSESPRKGGIVINSSPVKGGGIQNSQVNNNTSPNREYETCEKPNELMGGDSAQMSEYNPKLIVDWSESRQSSDIKTAQRAIDGERSAAHLEEIRQRGNVRTS